MSVFKEYKDWKSLQGLRTLKELHSTGTLKIDFPTSFPGDLLVRGEDGFTYPIRIGNESYILTSRNGKPIWAPAPTPPAGYTDKKAQNAVGNILISTDSITATYNPNIPVISFAVKEEYLHRILKKIELTFVVGESGGFGAGATEIQLYDCTGERLTGKKVNVFRERFLEFEGDDYTYDDVAGIITLLRPLVIGERCVIHLEDKRFWSKCKLVPQETNTREFSNSFSDEFN